MNNIRLEDIPKHSLAWKTGLLLAAFVRMEQETEKLIKSSQEFIKSIDKLKFKLK